MTDRQATTPWRGIPTVLALPAVALLAAALTASAYWPGLMSWDPVRQYGEALSGAISDWHPPMMQWIWRQAIRLHPGPVPMLLLQLELYWGGFTLLALAAWGRGEKRVAWALLACGLWPFGLALTGMILKDSLMAGALLVAYGLLAFREDRNGPAWGIAAAAMLLFAATLRFNAFTACLPLLVALLPRSWRDSRLRLVLASTVATFALIAAMPVANRLIGASPSGVELSLVIFDLGGITEHSGIDAFPAELDVRDPVHVNHGCYRPSKWDSYSDWVDPECPLGYTAWNDDVDPDAVDPYRFWARAIFAHPIAYAEHRLTHFAINTRIVPLKYTVERPVPHEGAPNPWGFHVTPNAAMQLIDAAAMATAHTPLGWPIVWIGLALGALLASRGVPAARLVAPIALSSLLYGSSYLQFSVAAELRYHLWTGLAALIATVLLLGDSEGRDRRRIILLFAPATLALIAGLLGRLVSA